MSHLCRKVTEKTGRHAITTEHLAPAKAAKLVMTKAKEELHTQRVNSWKEMPMYGQFHRNAMQSHVDQANTWKWLRVQGSKQRLKAS